MLTLLATLEWNGPTLPILIVLLAWMHSSLKGSNLYFLIILCILIVIFATQCACRQRVFQEAQPIGTGTLWLLFGVMVRLDPIYLIET